MQRTPPRVYDKDEDYLKLTTDDETAVVKKKGDSMQGTALTIHVYARVFRGIPKKLNLQVVNNLNQARNLKQAICSHGGSNGPTPPGRKDPHRRRLYYPRLSNY